MNLDINEEEREFLERVCIRAEIFARMGLDNRMLNSKFGENVDKVRILLEKLKKLEEKKPPLSRRPTLESGNRKTCS